MVLVSNKLCATVLIFLLTCHTEVILGFAKIRDRINMMKLSVEKN